MNTGHPYNQRPPTRTGRGVAAVELAILLVPLLMLLFGVIEYGRAIYQYNMLAKSVRDASRYLSSIAAGTGHDEATNLVVCGYTDCTGHDPVVPYLLPGMVKICDKNTIEWCPGVQHSAVNTGAGSINLVTVKISGYTYHPILAGFTFNQSPGGGLTVGVMSLTFGDISNTMRQPL